MTQYSYDDTGVYFAYFVATVLTLVLVPATHRWVFGGRQRFEKASSCQCSDCLAKFRANKRKDARKHRVSRLIKYAVLSAGWSAVAFLVHIIVTTEIETPTVWDPWAVLNISQSSTTADVKRAYRKLSLIHHPDKVADDLKEKANAIFADISKAYKVLTNAEARKAYDEYGHPDGKQAFSMGIALPTWIVAAHNSPYVLLGYGLVFGVLLPWRIGHWWYSTRNYTKDRVLSRTMAAFFKRIPEDAGLKTLLAVLSTAREFEETYLPDTNDKGKADALAKSTKDLQLAVSVALKDLGEDFPYPPAVTSRPAAAHALTVLLAHMMRTGRTPRSADDEQTIVRAVHLLQRGILQITLARGWLIPSLYTMDVTQLLVQGTWHTVSPMLQVPHVTDAHVKALKALAPQPVKSLQDLAEMDAAARRKVFRDLSDAQVEDMNGFLTGFPRIVLEKLDFRVLGEQAITPGAMVTCTIRIRLAPISISLAQLNGEYEAKKARRAERVAEAKKLGLAKPPRDAEDDDDEDDDEDFDALGLDGEGDGARGKAVKLAELPKLAHSPRFPANKRPTWWVFLGNVGSNRIINAVKVPDLRDKKTIKIQFQAPNQAGVFPFSVFIKSDHWVGSDMRLDIQMKVEELSNEARARAAAAAAELEDDISDPDEDTLAGQMAVLRGQRTRQSNAGDAAGQDDASSSSSSDDDSSSDEE
ncbi:secretory subunit [Allomyces javanicus]|nr:secretory subunit [Allomyces javanicus]